MNSEYWAKISTTTRFRLVGFKSEIWEIEKEDDVKIVKLLKKKSFFTYGASRKWSQKQIANILKNDEKFLSIIKDSDIINN